MPLSLAIFFIYLGIQINARINLGTKLVSSDNGAGEAALVRLARMKQGSRTKYFPTIYRALTESNIYGIRYRAIRALALIGPEASKAIPSLAACLKDDEDPQILSEAITALEKIGTKDAVEAIQNYRREKALLRAYESGECDLNAITQNECDNKITQGRKDRKMAEQKQLEHERARKRKERDEVCTEAIEMIQAGNVIGASLDNSATYVLWAYK
ncbi:MAG: HEAT repeat domain-containing protein [Elusimicrobiota bacterium]